MPNPDAWDIRRALHQAGYQLVEQHSFGYMADCYPYKRIADDSLPYDPVEDADPKRARYRAIAGAFGIEEVGT